MTVGLAEVRGSSPRGWFMKITGEQIAETQITDGGDGGLELFADGFVTFRIPPDRNISPASIAFLRSRLAHLINDAFDRGYSNACHEYALRLIRHAGSAALDPIPLCPDDIEHVIRRVKTEATFLGQQSVLCGGVRIDP